MGEQERHACHMIQNELEADGELLQLGRTFQPTFVMWLEGGRELRRELDQPLREIAERIMSASAATLAGFDLQLLAMAFAWYRWWPHLVDDKDDPAAVMLKQLLVSATAALPGVRRC
jgi:hypothetical protein